MIFIFTILLHYTDKTYKIKKKKFSSGPLNQINGLVQLFKKSKGEIIFLLDGDDTFKKNKLSSIFNLFLKNRNLYFIQDTPFLTNKNEMMYLKSKNIIIQCGQNFIQQVVLLSERNFLEFFLEKNKYPNLRLMRDYQFLLFKRINFS